MKHNYVGSSDSNRCVAGCISFFPIIYLCKHEREREKHDRENEKREGEFEVVFSACVIQYLFRPLSLSLPQKHIFIPFFSRPREKKDKRLALLHQLLFSLSLSLPVTPASRLKGSRRSNEKREI